MRKIIYRSIGVFLLVLCISINFITNIAFALETGKDDDYNITMKRDLLCLMMAYPEYVKNVIVKEDGRVYLAMKSGRELLYDDKKEKNFNQKLNNPDLQDMLEQIYPISDINNLMEENFDPGRFRVYGLLKDVYGKSKGEIQSNLVNVKIGYQNCLFNENNEASKSLKEAMGEITSVAKSKGKIYKCVFPTNGTFNYRLISGTNNLSAHSFGTAIDLASDRRDYWKWTTREEGQKRLDSYPREIVEIFEKNNFIWGGKWGHFDILHFEYRPEIIIKSKCFSKKPSAGKPWHDGVTSADSSVKEYIELIDKTIK